MHPQFDGEEGPDDRTGLSVLAFARRLNALRRSRSPVFGDRLFADPAWDILLELFVSHHEQRRLSVSAVGVGISSAATSLRYLALLETEGLVRRSPDHTDRRRSYVELTPAALSKLRTVLAQHAEP